MESSWGHPETSTPGRLQFLQDPSWEILNERPVPQERCRESAANSYARLRTALAERAAKRTSFPAQELAAACFRGAIHQPSARMPLEFQPASNLNNPRAAF